MASSSSLKLVCAILVCIVVAAPQAEAAITCGAVASKIAGCLGYLKGGPGPSAACCGGIKALNSMANTPADRRTACGCLQSEASAISGISYPAAAQLPGKCGVKVPYPISRSTDCSKVN